MARKKTLEHYLRQLRLIEEHREKRCEQNVRRHYKDLMTNLQEFLGVQYAQLAADDKLTYEILHQKGMYARFLEEVEQKVDNFSQLAAQEIRNTVQLTYQRAWEGMVNAVQSYNSYADLKLNLTGLRAVTPDIIKNAVNNKYMEKALQKNHKSTISDIRQQIGIGLSQGDRMSTMARRISEQVDKSYKKATCIARTEVHRVREAGYQDSSERLSQILKDNDSEYVMTKTWKTMQDMSVRPYQRKGKKGHKSFVKGKGPDHVKMHGVTVLVDEEFDLGDGVKAKAPGQSGVAGHDINCRCYLSRDLMTKAEFEKLTGRKLIEKSKADLTDKITKAEHEELAKTLDMTNEERAAIYYDKYGYVGYNADTLNFKEFSEKLFTNKNYSDIIKSGAVSGARNPFGERAKEHADKYYESVRKMKTDVSRISKTTGYSKAEMQEVKDYIFNELHDLGGIELERFEPDYMMAESWRRLIDGKPEPHDLTMIRHEIFEKELIKQGYSQAEAHIKASKKYNYSKEANEYYDKNKKYKD